MAENYQTVSLGTRVNSVGCSVRLASRTTRRYDALYVVKLGEKPCKESGSR